ncbi:hypothetical protein H9Q69_001813 [Fusarium xylarioides]|uniref:Uncharacterized protein n=1 Tax=Fusarium xylarioides TaxID=221167 RepID=A0A9P7HYQ9_9HYPO|nr:hypothetical protein H9Q72_003606 [Fusarium xylarioides]KAG5799181.1 hypothetical protein H9Q69_001813 [Fusarium xylarioides]
MGQPKYRQMTAQFKGKDGVELKREPKDDPLVYKYGSNGIQQVNLEKRLLTYTLFIDFTDPDKAMGKLWKVLSKMKVFEEWEATQVFGVRVRNNGQCDYFAVPAAPAS